MPLRLVAFLLQGIFTSAINEYQKMDSLIKQIFSAGCQTGHKQYKALFLGGKMSMIPLHVMHLLSAKQ